MGLFDWIGSLFGGKKREEEERLSSPSRSVSITPTPTAPTIRQNPATALSAIPGREPVAPTPTIRPWQMPDQLQKVVDQEQQKTKLQKLQDNQRRMEIEAQKAAESRKRWETVNKATEVFGSLPVVSSLAKPATWLIGKGADIVGAKDVAESARNVGSQMSLGMSQDELRAIPDDQRWKFGALQAADTLLSPLDLLGLKSIATAPIYQGAKSAVKQGVGDVLTNGLNRNARMLIRQGMGDQARNAAIGFVPGAGLSAGVQQWIGGEIDPLEVFRGGLIGSAFGGLTPGGSPRGVTDDIVASGIKTVNPERLNKVTPGNPLPGVQDNLGAGEFPTKNTPTIGELDRVARNDTSTQQPLPDSDFDADARRVEEGSAESPLDVPTFQRQTADTDVSNLNSKLGALGNIDFFRNNPQMLRHLARTDPEIRALLAAEGIMPDLRYNQFNRGGVIDAEARMMAELQSAQRAQQAQQQINESQQVIDPTSAGRAAAAQEGVSSDQAAQAAAIAESVATPAPVATPIPERVTQPASVAPAVQSASAVNPEQVASQMAQVSQERPGFRQSTTDETPLTGDVKAPRQARILLDQEVDSADRAALEKLLPRKSGQSLQSIQDRATVELDAMGDVNNIAQRYAGESLSLDNSVLNYYKALEAARRLSGRVDPVSREARSNIYNAMLDFASDAGLNLRATKILWGDMPVEMKVSTVIKQIEKMREKAYGPDDTRVKFSPEDRAVTEAQFMRLLEKEQAIKDDASVVQARVTVDEAQTNPGRYSREDVANANKILEDADKLVYQNLQDFSRVYGQYVPDSPKASKLADYQRTAMLSSPTGAALDIISTGVSAGSRAAAMGVEGLMGRVLNKVTRSPGRFVDRGVSPLEPLRALPGALKRVKDEYQGNLVYDSIEDVVRQRPSINRTDLSGSRQGKVGNFVRASRNAATQLSSWVGDAEVARRVRQEGLKRGFSGEELDVFVEASKHAESPEIRAKAEQIQRVVNNINDNPVTRFSRGLGNLIEQAGKAGGPRGEAVGKFIRNSVMPFPTFLGGQLWNSLTDRNVIANATKLIVSAKRKDGNVMENLSKLAVGGAEAGALGYMLAQAGVLTTEDANGKDYEGLYFHIGNDYIPVPSFFAQFPNIAMGYAAHQGFSSEDSPEGVLDKITTTIGEMVGTLAKGLSVDSLTGGGSYLVRSADDLMDGEAGDAAATALSGFASQFIPSATGDINAGLDNYTDMNQTNEAALTKATFTNPETGRENTDVGQTALNNVLNRIPGVSQMAFDRQEGVMAKDVTDRIFRGNRESDSQISDRQAEAAIKDRSKDFKERDIPDPDRKGADYSFSEHLQAKIDRGEYPAAIEGMEAELENLRANPITAPSTLEEKELKLNRLKVAQSGGFGPSVMELYLGDGPDGVSLEEWRDLGDPDSEDYNMPMYELLWQIDQAMAEAGVSDSSKDRSKGKYYTKESKSGSGGSGSRRSPQSFNDIGSPVSLGRFRTTNLTPRQTGTTQMPNITKLKPSELVKRRKISVSR